MSEDNLQDILLISLPQHNDNVVGSWSEFVTPFDNQRTSVLFFSGVKLNRISFLRGTNLLDLADVRCDFFLERNIHVLNGDN